MTQVERVHTVRDKGKVQEVDLLLLKCFIQSNSIKFENCHEAALQNSLNFISNKKARGDGGEETLP